MFAVKFVNNKLMYLDQTKLPLKEVWRECKTAVQGYKAIKELQVRGAPLIGVFAAYCMYVGLKDFKGNNAAFLKKAKQTAHYLNSSRPTAVNLSWALKRIVSHLEVFRVQPVEVLKKVVLEEAKAIHQEDQELCASMAEFGAGLVCDNDVILTHCNAGSLATGGEGTAVGVIYCASRRYKNIKVYADETRPLLQGARLTAWELHRGGVDVTVICDNMAAVLMQQGKIDKVFVGADRIASNGDTANKIGTYNVAVIADYHKVPFYVVAPFSTFDLSLKSGKDIPIEHRNKDEVRNILGRLNITPLNAQAFNPAFDVTPHELIAAIVTDKGIIKPPFGKNIKKILAK